MALFYTADVGVPVFHYVSTWGPVVTYVPGTTVVTAGNVPPGLTVFDDDFSGTSHIGLQGTPVVEGVFTFTTDSTMSNGSHQINDWVVTIERVTLTDVIPGSGLTIGGTVVTLKGTKFRVGIAANFDSIALTSVAFVDSETATGVTPAHIVGLVRATVTNTNGAFGSLDDAFEYLQAKISSVSPSHGPMAGGELVTIIGAGFVVDASITFDGLDATDVTFVSDTEYTCRTPPHSVGPVTIRMVGDTGVFTATYTYDPVGGTVWTRGGVHADARYEPVIEVSRTKGGTSSLAFAVGDDGVPPIAGQAISLDLGDGPVLDGVALSVAQTYEGDPTQPVHVIDIAGNNWLLNAERPFGSWDDVSATTVVKEIMAFAPDGFTSTGVQASMPSISLVLDGTLSITESFDKIVTLLPPQSSWYLDEKNVHLFTTEALTNPATITDDNVDDLLASDPPITVTEDVSQIRNRVYGIGNGSVVTRAASPGQSVIEVVDLKPFKRTGGFAISNGQIISYGGAHRISEAVYRKPGPTVSGGGTFRAVNTALNPTMNGPIRDYVNYKMTFVDYSGEESSMGPLSSHLYTDPQVSNYVDLQIQIDELRHQGFLSLGSVMYGFTWFTADGETAIASLGNWFQIYYTDSALGLFIYVGNAPGECFIRGNSNGSGRELGFNIYRQHKTNYGMFQIASLTFAELIAGAALRDPLNVNSGYWYKVTDYLHDDSLSGPNPLVWWVHDPLTGRYLSAPTNTTGISVTVAGLPTISNPLGGLSAVDIFHTDVPWLVDVPAITPGDFTILPDLGNPVFLDDPPDTTEWTFLPVQKFVNNQQLYVTNMVEVNGHKYTVRENALITAAGTQLMIVEKLGQQLVGNEQVTVLKFQRKLYRAQDNNPDTYRVVKTFDGDNSTIEWVDTVETDPPSQFSVSFNPNSVEQGPPIVPVSEAPPPLPPIMHMLLTGIPTTGPGSIVKTIPKDASINVFVQEDSVAAQTELASRQGGKGVRSYTVPDTSLTESDLVKRVHAEILMFAWPIRTITYASWDTDIIEGRTQPFSLSHPPISGDFLIQTVRETEVHILDGRSSKRIVTASSVRFTLDDLFRKTEEKIIGAGGGGGSSASGNEQFVSPASLTTIDDDNIQAELTGAPSIALLASTQIAFKWNGLLSQARGGTGKDTSGARDGQLLVGKSSDGSFELATLTAGQSIGIANTPGGITISTAAPFVIGEQPSGVIDGINQIYTLSRPFVRGTVQVYLNGLRLVVADYSELVPNRIYLRVPPLVGDVLTVDFG